MRAALDVVDAVGGVGGGGRGARFACAGRGRHGQVAALEKPVRDWSSEIASTRCRGFSVDALAPDWSTR